MHHAERDNENSSQYCWQRRYTRQLATMRSEQHRPSMSMPVRGCSYRHAIQSGQQAHALEMATSRLADGWQLGA